LEGEIMASDVLIVMLESSVIRARVVGTSRKTSDETEKSRIFETEMASIKGALRDAVTVLLEEMESEGFKDFKRVLLGLPGHLASLRVLKLPFTDADKAEEVLAFELADTLVEDPDSLVFGALPLEGGRTLAVTIEKDVIESTLKTFEELGLTPDWLGLPLLYKDRLLRALHTKPSVAAFVDARSITVLKNGSAAHYGYLSDSTDLKFSLAALEGEGIIVEDFYLTEMTADWVKGIESVDSLDAERVHITDYIDEFAGLNALTIFAGEASGTAGKKGTLNFRKGAYIDKRVYESTKRSFRVATILIVLVAFFWGINIYTRLQVPVQESARIESALFSAFSSLFPNDAAVDPLYQMEVKLKELKKEKEFVGGGIDVLERLKSLSRVAPGESSLKGRDEVRLYEVKMHKERVVARGETASFDHADRFKESLAATGEYKDISLTDVKSKVDGSVSFSIALTLQGEG
jgi:type II secretory pathway component PulL